MSWWTYVTGISNTESPKAMQTVTGIDGPHFSKWKTGVIPGPEIAARFARAYNRPVLEAFVAAGFLTPEEANERPTARPSLSSLSEIEMLEEVLERLKRGGDHGGDTAATKAPGPGPDNVTYLGDQAAARDAGKPPRSKRQPPSPDPDHPHTDDPDDFEPR